MAFSGVFIFVLFVSSLCSTLAWSDCGTALNSEVPRFTQFVLFPNPVQVGQTVHARAVVSLESGITAGTITGGLISMIIDCPGALTISVTDISLCNSTSSINCSVLAAGGNAFSFDFLVPQIPAGDYTITLIATIIGFSEQGCVTFDVTVTDPTSTSTYTSWLQATLAGVAQFSTVNYTQRQLGDLIQVGPIGPVASSASNSYQWGTFIDIEGSQDLLGTSFSPVGYVWGLNGNMTGKVIASDGVTILQQQYKGTFYLGYVSSLLQRKLDSEIVDGVFTLTWSFSYGTGNGVTSKLSGSITFDDAAVLPTGWSAPVTVGRLGTFSLYTNDAGNLIVNASKKYCLTSDPCDFGETGAAPSKSGLTDKDIAIIVALVVGMPLIAALIGATLLYLRHRRRHEQEAGIFSAARKPEYGNALVIDDIIQESREHGSSLIPQLERRPGDTESDYSDDEHEGLRSPKSNSTRSRSRRGHDRRSRFSRSPPHSDSDEEPNLNRKRSRSRSNERSRSIMDDSYEEGSGDDR